MGEKKRVCRLDLDGHRDTVLCDELVKQPPAAFEVFGGPEKTSKTSPGCIVNSKEKHKRKIPRPSSQSWWLPSMRTRSPLWGLRKSLAVNFRRPVLLGTQNTSSFEDAGARCRT